MNQSPKSQTVSRRTFIRDAALGLSALAVIPLVGCRSAAGSPTTGPARRTIDLSQDWRFGGKFSEAALQTGFDDSAFTPVTLPHTVARLSWQGWQFSDWMDVWIYRRHFSLPRELNQQRVFLHFDGVVSAARPVLNGHALPEQVGGYLPFQYEITHLLAESDNVLAVTIDGRWQNAPPEGAPRGPGAVDFFEPAGITRPVSLSVVPQIFLSDVFAKPVNILDSNRRVEVGCTIDAALVPDGPARIQVKLVTAGRTLATVSQAVPITQTGTTEAKLTLTDLGDIKLWDVDSPQLYDVVVTLFLADMPVHEYRTRIGFREARFELDGF